MASFVALLVVVAVAAVAAPVYGKDYVVGDSKGWTSGVDYTTWAKDKTFGVGDTLTFQYGSFHNVDEVSKADYSSCSSSNSIQSYSDQNTKITLSKPGTRYFICGSTGHCSAGMKLAVTVAAAAAADAPAPSTPKSTPKATPKAATPKAAPAADDTPSTTPETSTPTDTATTDTPTASSKSTTTSTNGAMDKGPIKGLWVGTGTVLAALGLAFMG